MSKSKATTSAKGKSPAASKTASVGKTAAAVKKPAAAKAKPAPAAKPAAAKKTAAKKPAAGKSPVVKKTTAKPAPSPTATVVAEIDIGFGNQLFIRGNGAGLSWDKGVLMTCVGNDRWEWSSDGLSSPITCKVVLNDTIWSEGDDLSLAPGETKVIRPAF